MPNIPTTRSRSKAPSAGGARLSFAPGGFSPRSGVASSGRTTPTLLSTPKQISAQRVLPPLRRVSQGFQSTRPVFGVQEANAFARSIETYGQFEQKRQDFRTQLRVDEIFTDAEAYFVQYMSDVAKQPSSTMTDKFLLDFEGFSNSIVSEEKDPKAKQILGAKLNKLGVSLLPQVLNMQSKYEAIQTMISFDRQIAKAANLIASAARNGEDPRAKLYQHQGSLKEGVQNALDSKSITEAGAEQVLESINRLAGDTAYNVAGTHPEWAMGILKEAGEGISLTRQGQIERAAEQGMTTLDNFALYEDDKAHKQHTFLLATTGEGNPAYSPENHFKRLAEKPNGLVEIQKRKDSIEIANKAWGYIAEIQLADHPDELQKVADKSVEAGSEVWSQIQSIVDQRRKDWHTPGKGADYVASNPVIANLLDAARHENTAIENSYPMFSLPGNVATVQKTTEALMRAQADIKIPKNRRAPMFFKDAKAAIGVINDSDHVAVADKLSELELLYGSFYPDVIRQLQTPHDGQKIHEKYSVLTAVRDDPTLYRTVAQYVNLDVKGLAFKSPDDKELIDTHIEEGEELILDFQRALTDTAPVQGSATGAAFEDIIRTVSYGRSAIDGINAEKVVHQTAEEIISPRMGFVESNGKRLGITKIMPDGSRLSDKDVRNIGKMLNETLRPPRIFRGISKDDFKYKVDVRGLDDSPFSSDPEMDWVNLTQSEKDEIKRDALYAYGYYGMGPPANAEAVLFLFDEEGSRAAWLTTDGDHYTREHRDTLSLYNSWTKSGEKAAQRPAFSGTFIP